MRRLRRGNTGAVSDGVDAPVQYGPRIGAFVLFELHYQLLPEKSLLELYGRSLCG